MTFPDASIARDPRDNTPKVLPIVHREGEYLPVSPPLHPPMHALPMTGTPRICCYCSVEMSTDAPFCYPWGEPVPADKMCEDCYRQAIAELQVGYHSVLSHWLQLRQLHVALLRGYPVQDGCVLLPFRRRGSEVQPRG